MYYMVFYCFTICGFIIAGSFRVSYLIYSGCAYTFLRGGGEKNQGFMLIRLLDAGNMIGCGGDLLGF